MADLTVDLIKDKEGFSPSAYWDVNAWRAGYGSDTWTDENGKVHKVTPDTVVTAEDATRDLARRIPQTQQKGVIQYIGQESWDKLSPSQQAAVTSLAYNYGGLDGLPTLTKAIKSGDAQAISSAIAARAGDNDGVNAARRQEEAKLALNAGGASPSAQMPSNVPTDAMYGVRLPPGAPKPTTADYQAVNSVPNRTAMSSMGVSAPTMPATGLGGLADPRMASLMTPQVQANSSGSPDDRGAPVPQPTYQPGMTGRGLPAVSAPVAPYQNLPAPAPLQSSIPARVAPTPAPPPNRAAPVQAPAPAPAQNTGTTASGKTVQLGVPIGRADSEGRMTYTTYGNVNGVAVPVDHTYPPIVDIAKESGNQTIAGGLIRGEIQKAAGNVQEGVSNTVNAAKDTVATNLGAAKDNALGAIGNAGNFIGGLFGGGAPKPKPMNSSGSPDDRGSTGLASVPAPAPTGLAAVSKPTSTQVTIANPAYIDWQKTYGTGGANSTLLDIHDMRDDATMAAQQSAIRPPAPPAPPKTITVTRPGAAPAGLAAVAAPPAPPKPRYVDGLGAAATEMKRQDKARSDFYSGVAKSIL